MESFGLEAVDLGGGMKESHFGVTQKIREESNAKFNKPMFFGMTREPFTFTMYFAKHEAWTQQQRIELAHLIFKPYYQEMTAEKYPNILFNVVCVDEGKKVLNGIEQGYVAINFRTDSAYGWALPQIDSHSISGASEATPYEFTIRNDSNVVEWYEPEIEFKTVGTSLQLFNMSDGGKEFSFTDLVAGEIVYVNNETRKVIGDQPYPQNYRIGNFNRGWLRLKYGDNTIKVTTDCELSIKLQCPMMI